MCRMLKREIKSLFSNVKDIGNRILYIKGAPVNVYPTQQQKHRYYSSNAVEHLLNRKTGGE